MADCLQKGRLTFLLSVGLLFLARVASAQDDAIDRESYYRAVSYCRTNSPWSPITLSPDKHIMCFDAPMTPNLDVSATKTLDLGGLFVVRSAGGREDKAIELANLIRDRHATVVVYDYCFSACAEFVMTAPNQTYVLKGGLVLWHNPQSSDPNHPFCAFLSISSDGGPKKLRRGPCREGHETNENVSPLEAQYFRERAINPYSVMPPDSIYVRKRVTSLYRETGLDRDILWTLNPRYYPHLFKANIVFEAYPESQEEVDATAARLGFKATIIYDP
jgi:hypothetical protein